MRTLQLFSIITITAISTTAAADLRGSGHVIDEQRNVGDFTGVSVGAGIQVKVETGPRGPLAVRGEDNVLPHVMTEIKGGILVIGFEKNLGISTTEAVVVSFRAPRLDDLSASGGASLETNTPCGDSFHVSASGGAHVKVTAQAKAKKIDIDVNGAAEVAIDSIEAGEAKVSISGAAIVKTAGNVQSLVLGLSGAAQLDAANLKASSMKVDGSGGSRGKLRVAGPVTGSISGGTSLRVGPDAAVNVDASGGSSIQR